MATDLSYELQRARSDALRFGSSLGMSNTKWRAVLKILGSRSLSIRQIMIKFIDVADTKVMGLPWLDAPHAFADSLEFGPFPLVSIEWIEIPAIAVFPRSNHVPAEKVTQDIEAVERALIALGKGLPLKVAESGLQIIGHVR